MNSNYMLGHIDVVLVIIFYQWQQHFSYQLITEDNAEGW